MTKEQIINEILNITDKYKKSYLNTLFMVNLRTLYLVVLDDAEKAERSKQ